MPKGTGLPKKKVKHLNYSKLRKKAETIFHRWIRERDKDKGCITCTGKTEQAGHWFHNTCDFEEWNLHGQDVSCNYFRGGAGEIYTLRMVEKHGLEQVQKWTQEAHRRRGQRYTVAELRSFIEKYSLPLVD